MRVVKQFEKLLKFIKNVNKGLGMFKKLANHIYFTKLVFKRLKLVHLYAKLLVESVEKSYKLFIKCIKLGTCLLINPTG